MTPSTPISNDYFVNPNVLRPEDVIYEAESPDEAALVYCAKGYGITLMSRLLFIKILVITSKNDYSLRL